MNHRAHRDSAATPAVFMPDPTPQPTPTPASSTSASAAAEMNDAVEEALNSLQDDDPPTARDDPDEFPLHDVCTAVLTMKCGSPVMAVRKKLHEDIAVSFVPGEGFAVFQSKIERHFVKIAPTYVQEHRAIYLKPSTNATQSKYLLLNKDNFETALRMRWKVAKPMKHELKFEIFCYFVDTSSSKKERKRHLTAKMLQQHQLQQVQNDASVLLAEPPTNSTLATAAEMAALGSVSNSFLPFATASTPSTVASSGSAASFSIMPAHALASVAFEDVATSMIASGGGSMSAKRALPPANRPVGAAPNPSSSTLVSSPVFESSSVERPRKIPRVAQSANGSSTVIDPPSVPVPHFVPIPFRINGVVVPLEVDVNALRRSLRLESHECCSCVQRTSEPPQQQLPPQSHHHHGSHHHHPSQQQSTHPQQHQQPPRR